MSRIVSRNGSQVTAYDHTIPLTHEERTRLKSSADREGITQGELVGKMLEHWEATRPRAGTVVAPSRGEPKTWFRIPEDLMVRIIRAANRAELRVSTVLGIAVSLYEKDERTPASDGLEAAS